MFFASIFLTGLLTGLFILATVAMAHCLPFPFMLGDFAGVVDFFANLVDLPIFI